MKVTASTPDDRMSSRSVANQASVLETEHCDERVGVENPNISTIAESQQRQVLDRFATI
jgi:hypothetical protein